jgi:hypothetical protein
VNAAGSSGAGHAGAGGANAEPFDKDPLIDDFEGSLDGLLPSRGNRIGRWYTYNDGQSGTTQVPDEKQSVIPAFDGNDQALHTYGKTAAAQNPADYWGAGVAADLNNPDGGNWTKLAYDAKARGFTGIRFRAKVANVAAAKKVQVRFVDIYTDPSENGVGECSKCFDDYYKTETLTNTWALYLVCFTQLKRDGWGLPNKPFATHGLLAIQFRWLSGVTFDLWLDDVEFVGTDQCAP